MIRNSIPLCTCTYSIRVLAVPTAVLYVGILRREQVLSRALWSPLEELKLGLEVVDLQIYTRKRRHAPTQLHSQFSLAKLRQPTPSDGPVHQG